MGFRLAPRGRGEPDPVGGVRRPSACFLISAPPPRSIRPAVGAWKGLREGPSLGGCLLSLDKQTHSTQARSEMERGVKYKRTAEVRDRGTRTSASSGFLGSSWPHTPAVQEAAHVPMCLQLQPIQRCCRTNCKIPGASGSGWHLPAPNRRTDGDPSTHKKEAWWFPFSRPGSGFYFHSL